LAASCLCNPCFCAAGKREAREATGEEKVSNRLRTLDINLGKEIICADLKELY